MFRFVAILVIYVIAVSTFPTIKAPGFVTTLVAPVLWISVSVALVVTLILSIGIWGCMC